MDSLSYIKAYSCLSYKTLNRSLDDKKASIKTSVSMLTLSRSCNRHILQRGSYFWEHNPYFSLIYNAILLTIPWNSVIIVAWEEQLHFQPRGFPWTSYIQVYLRFALATIEPWEEPP